MLQIFATVLFHRGRNFSRPFFFRVGETPGTGAPKQCQFAGDRKTGIPLPVFTPTQREPAART
jgi:hypothetical protein